MGAKKAVNVSIQSELLDAARAEGINLSATLEAALADQVRIRRRNRWQTENEAAIEAYNRDVDENGSFGDNERSFLPVHSKIRQRHQDAVVVGETRDRVPPRGSFRKSKRCLPAFMSSGTGVKTLGFHRSTTFARGGRSGNIKPFRTSEEAFMTAHPDSPTSHVGLQNPSTRLRLGVAALAVIAMVASPQSYGAAAPVAPAAGVQPYTTPVSASQVKYGSVNVEGLNIAYREAGDPRSPKLVLLHGWPSSSHQYRDLIPALAGRFHLIAPDYQGFGNSDHPDPATYHYSFDAISETIEKFLATKGFDHYGLFVQDYGGPVGFRIVGRNPHALDWLVIQNTNAYEVGFSAAWDGFRKALWVNRTAENEAPLAAFNTLDAIKNTVYLGGAGHPELIAPESYQTDAASVAGEKNLRIQLDLFYDYRTNPMLYPEWQAFLRDNQPKTLIFWGEHDPFFTPEGGEAYLEDLPKAEMHRLNAGHFATEDNLPYIASHIISFYDHRVKPAK